MIDPLSFFSHPSHVWLLATPWIARPLCPSPSPKVCSSSCPLHWWCHPTISSSDALFFCPQSFPAWETFPMSQLFSSDDQNTGVSASASALPMSNSGWISLKIDWFHLFAVQETLRSLFHHHSSKASVPQCSASFMIQLSQLFVTLEDYSLDYTDLCQQSNVSAFQHTV